MSARISVLIAVVSAVLLMVAVGCTSVKIENRKSKIENIGSPIGREKDGGPAREKRSSKDSSKPVSTDKTEPANSSIGNEQPS
ncbi:MAG: hypothetical protein MUP16_07455, partial [Sedimentisphaerales bacterium]|nr:hypothetical protein [Sedimentisphaerales bacterium]